MRQASWHELRRDKKAELTEKFKNFAFKFKRIGLLVIGFCTNRFPPSNPGAQKRGCRGPVKNTLIEFDQVQGEVKNSRLLKWNFLKQDFGMELDFISLFLAPSQVFLTD
jgi:hypothetical protein